MLRPLIFVTLLATPVLAQDHTAGMDHSAHMTGASVEITQPGQSAFAAIEEIVIALENDPMTNWQQVNIPALREHLRDMDLVFTSAEVTAETVPNGQKFTVTGTGRVREAIRNMVIAHASVMDGVDGWHFETEDHAEGVVLIVTTQPIDAAKLKALGFFGIMAQGMHHQSHHWMMATGGNPHN